MKNSRRNDAIQCSSCIHKVIRFTWFLNALLILVPVYIINFKYRMHQNNSPPEKLNSFLASKKLSSKKRGLLRLYFDPFLSTFLSYRTLGYEIMKLLREGPLFTQQFLLNSIFHWIYQIHPSDKASVSQNQKAWKHELRTFRTSSRWV